ncbi:MAG: ATP synthase F1 subunit delta [Candidatus Moranbacteria bacterium RBG_13_45_13]|nr:MAG: ATP synthase F1 subunit delta [Candidatus Moranbacteria bacterium RBG_13_45_13]
MHVTPKQYAQTLYDLTDGQSKPQVEKAVADFALHMYRERKLKLADKIIEQFGKIYNKEKNIVEAELTTRKKLDEPELKKIRNYVKEKYGAKEVVLKNIVDEGIGGGIVLKVGDEVMDGSVAGRLEELKKVLVK